RHRPVGLVVGGRTADEIEVLRVRMLLNGLDAESARPVGPLGARQTVGIALRLNAPQSALRLLGKFALLQDQAATHVHDLWDVLDKHRALLLAGAAGDAGPDLIFLDGVPDQLLRPWSVASLLGGRIPDGLVEILARIDDDH